MNSWKEYVNSKLAEGLKPETLEGYRSILRDFAVFMTEKKGEGYLVDRGDIEEYLVLLKTKPAKHTILSLRARGKPVSDFRRRNVWVALSSFFTWAEGRGMKDNPMKRIPAPKTPKKVIQIFNATELERLLEHMKTRNSPNRLRDELIVRLFMDTGIRLNELVELEWENVDIIKNEVLLHGKGAKERVVPYGLACAHTMLAYRTGYKGKLFYVSGSRIRRMITDNCREIGIKPRGPHHFRHTFACNYLLKGGDIFSLQYLLGHSSLAMVAHYSQWVRKQQALKNYHDVMG